MNFKSFGTFVLAAGLFLAVVGAVIATSAPPAPKLTEPSGWRRDLERIYMSDPTPSAERREQGTAIAIPGIIVAFIGLAIIVSSKKTGPRNTSQPPYLPRFCTTCGFTVTRNAAYCSNCGASIGESTSPRTQ